MHSARRIVAGTLGEQMAVEKGTENMRTEINKLREKVAEKEMADVQLQNELARVKARAAPPDARLTHWGVGQLIEHRCVILSCHGLACTPSLSYAHSACLLNAFRRVVC
eukprot:6203503-Pleurochrysis_carterae.AAC.2